MSLESYLGPVDNLPDLATAELGPKLFGRAGGSGVDNVVNTDADWGTFVGPVPPEETGRFLGLVLGPTPAPAAAWATPLPIVAVAPDGRRDWHRLRDALPFVDLVLGDAETVMALERTGFPHARSAVLAGLPPQAPPDPHPPHANRGVDIVCLGGHGPRAQADLFRAVNALLPSSGNRHIVVRPATGDGPTEELLRNAKVVLSLGAPGRRSFQAVAAGALLFAPAGDIEITRHLEPGKEYVPFTPRSLGHLIDHHLVHDGDRVGIAEAAQRKCGFFSITALWRQALAVIEREWPDVRRRAAGRIASGRRPGWRVCLTAANRKEGAARSPRGPDLLNAVGVLAGPPERAERAFAAALGVAPGYALAGLNRAEALSLMGQDEDAVAQARQSLSDLDRLGREGLIASGGWHYSPEGSRFRDEWEWAARGNAADPDSEASEKRSLLRWRLHSLLATLTGELDHYYRAAVAGPDIPEARAALGCALARAGRFGDALPYLEGAVDDDPLDGPAAHALFELYGELKLAGRRAALAAARRRLSAADPRSVPPEPWFTPGDPPAVPAGPELRGVPPRVYWDNDCGEGHSLAAVNREVRRSLAEHDCELVDDPASAEAVVRHRYPPGWNAPEAGYWVMMQPWEFGRVPAEWVERITRDVDEVWAPAEYVRRCFVDSGVPADLVHVVPYGVDPGRFRPGLGPLPLATGKRFKFLFVGGTIWRKGFDVLLRAYGEEFGPDDDVCLVVKDVGGDSSYQGMTAERRIAEFRSRPDSPEVEYMSRRLTADGMAALYGACDCLAHPYRGEGFGLPVAEAMACGLPAVVTSGGATDDFCPPEAAFRLPARVTQFPEDRVDHMPTAGRPWVLEPDREKLREVLRLVYADPEVAAAKGRAASDFILTHFTWGHTASRVADRLASLRTRPARRKAEPRFVEVGIRSTPPAYRPKVSLCMIVKDESENLPDCLQGLADLFDEMVVIDTGSSDGTGRLARSLGAKVHEFTWVDSFAAARNESLRLATGDWVFWLDADDRLDAENRDRLRGLFRSLRDEDAAFVMKCLCVPDGEGTAATAVDHVRLFRNRPGVRWRYRVHEQILPALRESGADVRWADVVIRHVGYVDPALRRRKLERDLRLLTLEREESGDEPFNLFNLGSVYNELGRPRQALPLLEKSLELSDVRDSIVRKLFALIAGCHRSLGDNAAALGACRRGRGHYPNDAELLYLEAACLIADGQFGTAEARARDLIEGGEGDHFASVDASLRGHKAKHLLARCRLESGGAEEAGRLWRAALDESPRFSPAWSGLGELAIRSGDWPGLEEAVGRLRGVAPTEAAVLEARGMVARGESAEAEQLLRAELTRAPGSPQLLNQLGKLLLDLGREEEAVIFWERSQKSSHPFNAT